MHVEAAHAGRGGPHLQCGVHGLGGHDRGAITAAELLLLGTLVWSLVAVGLPGPPVVLLLVLVAGAVVGLLVVVMRALLRQATTLRTDMEAVI